jgi:outer membrane receptor protein involved in Fe transport
MPPRFRILRNFALLLATALPLSAQTRVCVQDASAAQIAGARIQQNRKLLAITGADGCTALPADTHGALIVAAEGFATADAQIIPGQPLQVTLTLAAVHAQVNVTASRTPLALESTASSVVSLSQKELQQTPGFTLDDRLRQVSGFQLYRRASSWASNPTSQGISLRGLGSSAPSRTLVLSDQVPLLDPFGAWVHWNEIPDLAVSDVEVMHGGASDLYGSSAIGGVINVLPVTPDSNAYAMDASGGSLGTYALDTLATGTRGAWSGLAASDYFHTDGYIPVPFPFRGTADADDNVHSQNGRVELRYQPNPNASLFARGNLLNEARQNGTELQTNATRLWRYVLGGDRSSAAWGRTQFRIYGSDEDYRQSFSSVTNNRNTETLTRLQRVPAQELGGAAQWAREFSHHLTFVAGADVRDIRGDDRETPIHSGVPQPVVSASARQRYTGVYGEALWLPGKWSFALSARLDHFTTFDGNQTTAGSATAIPQPTISQTVMDPRLGIVREITRNLSLTGSVFRAFRGPTLNELYRTGQVGQITMLANPNLVSERATGYEFGTLLSAGRFGSLRPSYFWTEINRPITNLMIAMSGSSITDMRENLGQIRSRGVSADYEAQPAAWIKFTSGYQYAKSTVTQFAPDPTLVGKWNQEVPRTLFSAGAALQQPRWGTLRLDLYSSGREYDDAENQFLLHSYTRFDAEAAHTFHRKWQAYVAGQNLFDRTIEVGRTPVLSVGTPRTLTVGVRKNLSSEGSTR